MRWVAAALLCAGCSAAVRAGPAPALPGPEEAAQAVAERFVRAVAGGEFERALGLTTARWRTRLDGDRFRADFEAEPLAPERLRRLQRALAGPVRVDGQRARLGLDGEDLLTLVHEGGAWRVDALTR